jgi:hypothetical protein
MQFPWPTAGVVFVTLQMVHTEPDRQAGRPQLEKGDDAGVLNRVHCHRQCHCKDSIREEGRLDLWDCACTPTRPGGRGRGMKQMEWLLRNLAKQKISFTESKSIFWIRWHWGYVSVNCSIKLCYFPLHVRYVICVTVMIHVSPVSTVPLKHSTVSLATVCWRTFQPILTRVWHFHFSADGILETFSKSRIMHDSYPCRLLATAPCQGIKIT